MCGFLLCWKTLRILRHDQDRFVPESFRGKISMSFGVNILATWQGREQTAQRVQRRDPRFDPWRAMAVTSEHLLQLSCEQCDSSWGWLSFNGKPTLEPLLENCAKSRVSIVYGIMLIIPVYVQMFQRLFQRLFEDSWWHGGICSIPGHKTPRDSSHEKWIMFHMICPISDPQTYHAYQC
jgi:hypothetical protein